MLFCISDLQLFLMLMCHAMHIQKQFTNWIFFWSSVNSSESVSTENILMQFSNYTVSWKSNIHSSLLFKCIIIQLTDAFLHKSHCFSWLCFSFLVCLFHHISLSAFTQSTHKEAKFSKFSELLKLLSSVWYFPSQLFFVS